MTRWLYLSIALTLATLAGTLYLYHFHYDELPERVPIHWNIQGEPDGWRDRDRVLGILLLAPGVMAGLVVLTVVLPWLSPKHFEVDQFRDTYGYVMTLVVALMGYIQVVILASSWHPELRLTRMMVAGIFLFFALLGNVLGRVRRNFWMGVRTPWTLASEKVWERTHRVTAWLFTGFGLAGFVAVLAGVPLLVCFIGLMIVALAPVLYSLVLYKSLEKHGKLETNGQ
jgi:uncharacterized membrane protein